MDPPLLIPPVRSLEFYYDDGNVIFQVRTSPLLPTVKSYLTLRHLQVSNVLYRLHKSVLAARLDLFGGMFILSNSGQQQSEDGQDDHHPVRIEDGVAIREDFEALIKHIYGQYVFYFEASAMAVG